MTASLPVVEPLQRALHLRSLDLFNDLGAHELAVFAALMREQWLRRGDVLHAPGRRVRQVSLLVEGRVRLEHDGAVRHIEAPGGVGLVELLAQIETPIRAVAETNALALVIDAPSFIEVLEEHFTLFLHLRAALGRQVRDQWRARRPAEAEAEVEGVAALPKVEGPLDLVQQLLRLHRVPELRRFGAGVLAALVGDQGELHLESGHPLWTEADDAEYFVLVVEGELDCRVGDEGSFRARPGSLLGMGAAFGGTRHFYGAVAATPVVGVRVDVASLLDVAEDHFHVALEILAYSARNLLRLENRKVERNQP